MSIQRRELLLSSFPLTAAFLLEADRKLHADTGLSEEPFDRQTYEFWTSQVSKPSQAFEEHGQLVSGRGGALPADAEFLYYSAESGWVRAASTEGDTPLTKSLVEKGDASVLLSVDTVRPSAENMRKIVSQKNGSLRLDLKQAIPLQQLSETLNWSAIASLFPGEQAFSDYHEIAFDPKSTWGQAKKVPLTEGVGFWAWNFSTQSKPSFWTQCMGMLNGVMGGGGSSSSGGASPSGASKSGATSSKSSTGKKAGAISSLLSLGMPAVAKTAFNTFNELFGSLAAKGGAKNEWIIHNSDTPLLATQDARQKHPGRAVALKSGSYLVIPADQSHSVMSGNYELTDGVVVPAGTKPADLDEAAKSTLPELTYIAVSAVVEPIS